MSLHICGVGELKEILVDKQFDVIISIKNPLNSINEQGSDIKFSEYLRQHAQTVYSFKFLDVRERFRQNEKRGRYPHPDDVDELIRHEIDVTKSRVLIHCTAGISRSTAFAYILLRESGMSKQEASTRVTQIRAIEWMNERIVHIYETMFLPKK